MPDITKDDLLCVFFLTIPSLIGLDAYDRTLELLVPRIRAPRCVSLLSCFYINSHKYGDGVRVSCLLPSTCMDEFLQEMNFIINDLNLIHVKAPKGPDEIVWHSDETLEIRYRRFLCRQNTIGLEMLETDRLFARRATAFIRCKSKPWEDDFRSQFEPVLLAMSPT